MGDFADSKYKEAKDAGDQAGMDAWKEGGTARAEMQAAGGALVAGLAGGSALGGAAGAGIASIAAGKLNELSGAIAGSNPTGNADMNQALGNIVSNAIATAAGGVVGGNAGAFSGYNVDRYNRQLHPEEKTLAKQLADKSGGKYTQTQIEDQLRIMGVSTNGTSESGAPATLIGQAPTDSGAQWISGGTTADGKPILTQVTAQANPDLQGYILANYGSASPGGVPSQFTYDRLSGTGSTNIAGPFTKMDKSDANFVRNTTADVSSMISTNAGRVSAVAAAGGAITPCSVVCDGIAFAGTIVATAADAVGQLANHDNGQYIFNGSTSLASNWISAAQPRFTPIVNELVNIVNGSGVATNAQGKINSILGPQPSNGKK